MVDYTSLKPLISIHIPKCGGSSLSDVLATWFGKGFYRHYYDEVNNVPPIKHALVQGLFKKKFKPGVCIHGHFNHKRGIGIQDYYPEVDQFITFLRDPFETHLSVYFYNKRLGNTAVRSGEKSSIIETNPTVSDFLKYAKTSHIPSFLPPQITLDNYRDILAEKFVFIGLIDKLQSSIDRLADILGYETIAVGHKNISDRPEDIPAGAREQFIANNPLAMAIYEYAASQFV